MAPADGEAIHRVELLADGTCAMLGEARGNQDRFEAIMADSEWVHDFTLTGGEGGWYLYSNFEPTALSESILAAQQDAAGLIEMPIVSHADVAERVDCSASTVGEHRRKIEARVFAQFTD